MTQASIHAIMGSSGGGKTTHLVKLLGRPKRRRTLIWSPKEAQDNYAALYPGSVVCTSAMGVLNILRQAGAAGPFHIVFRPSLVRKTDEKVFSVVCQMALAVGKLTFVVDELHTVTKAAHAPDGWSKLVMMGRASQVEIFGLSQRPASMDKDFLGNCSTIHTRRLSYPDDAATVAKSLGVRAADVAALNGFMWLERDTLTGKVTRG